MISDLGRRVRARTAAGITGACALVLGASVVLAGCAGVASRSQPAVSSVPPGSLPVEAPLAGEATHTLPSDPGIPLPTADTGTPAPVPTPHEDPALEERLVTAVADPSFQTWSLAGESAVAGATYLPLLLAGLGKAPADLSTAVAGVPGDATNTLVFGLRVNGASTTDLMAAFLTVTSTSAIEDTFAGKSLRRVDLNGRRSWIYATGDTLYLIQSTDSAIAQTVIGRLP